MKHVQGMYTLQYSVHMTLKPIRKKEIEYAKVSDCSTPIVSLGDTVLNQPLMILDVLLLILQ